MSYKYKAVWRYSACCLRKGQIVAECEADSLPEFARKLVAIYAYSLGDDFCHAVFETEQAILACYDEDVPDWWTRIPGDNAAYPVHVFTSNSGEEILCNPSATAIINQIHGEGYGDYDLTITGI